jgi:GNAT superfamily N-acetyltransferase
MEWRRRDGYVVSDDKSLLELEKTHRWLNEESYWAKGRPFDVFVTAVENSLGIGCYSPDGAQVGFCRWVTDRATFGWLCDVFVDQAARGSGLGTFMVGNAIVHPAVSGVRLRLLATRDAHGLYAKFGFVPGTGDWMEISQAD